MPLLRKTRMRCSCGHQYHGDSRRRKCPECGAARLRRATPKHRAALKLDRAVFVKLNGGDHCGICGTQQKPGGRALHRDHDHRTGQPRGILCFPCNGALRPYMDRRWLEAAAAYLARTESAIQGPATGPPSGGKQGCERD
jgi:hypothetical protein